jgi:hypothetical protein
MAELQQTQILPADFIKAAGETYLGDLSKAVGGIKGLDMSKLYGNQFVAGQSQLQGQAEGLASGLGGYQPYLQAAGQNLGPTAYQQYMSPYQQDVMDTTLSQFDIQAQKGMQPLADNAIRSGAFGGAREGVQRAEYQNQSDMNRAALQANLLNQGYGQAQNMAQQPICKSNKFRSTKSTIIRPTNCRSFYIRSATTSSNSSRTNCGSTISLSTRISTFTSCATLMVQELQV